METLTPRATAIARLIAVALVGIVALLLAATSVGCSDKSKPSADASKMPKPQLEGTQWILTELPLTPEKIPPAATADASVDKPGIRFDEKEKRVVGYTGLNHFNGPYTLSGKTLRFGPLAATRRAGPPELMRLEQSYIQALLATSGWRIEGQTLELLGLDERPVARFRPAPAAPAPAAPAT